MSSSFSVLATEISAQECLVTLVRILDNILNESSYTPKTRKLKTTNAALQRRVLSQQGGRPFLEACGFHASSAGVLELLPSNESKMTLWEARKALQGRSVELGMTMTSVMPVKPTEGNPTSQENSSSKLTPIKDEGIKEKKDEAVLRKTSSLRGNEPSTVGPTPVITTRIVTPTASPQGQVNPNQQARREEISKEELCTANEDDDLDEEIAKILNDIPDVGQVEVIDEPLATSRADESTYKRRKSSEMSLFNNIADEMNANKMNPASVGTDGSNSTVVAGHTSDTDAREVKATKTDCLESSAQSNRKKTTEAGHSKKLSQNEWAFDDSSSSEDLNDEIENVLNSIPGVTSATPSGEHKLKQSIPNCTLDDLEDKFASALSASSTAGVSALSVPTSAMNHTKAKPQLCTAPLSPPPTPTIHNKASRVLSSDSLISLDSSIELSSDDERVASGHSSTPPVLPDKNIRIAQVKEQAKARHMLRSSSRKLLHGMEDEDDSRNSWRDLSVHMKTASLEQVFEPCWAALCKLSLLCSELSLEGMGLPMKDTVSHIGHRSSTTRLNMPWLPYEVLELLWKGVLGTHDRPPAKIIETCRRLYLALVENRAVDVYKRREDDGDMPHLTWMRIHHQSSALLRIGLSLPIVEERSADWIESLAKDLKDDMQLWYGRFALPTIVLGSPDGLERVQSLLTDAELVQSRLDIIGVVSGTQRHIQDCQKFVTKAQSEARKERLTFKRGKDGEDSYDEPITEIGICLVLEACQQVAAHLYRLGQMTMDSHGRSRQKLELATALHYLGMAVGEWGDYEFEMQLYVKSLKLRRDAGQYGCESVADTLLCMGACNVSQSNLSAAMSCYEEAHDMFKAHLGNEHEKVAKCLHAMGVIHCQREEPDAAMNCFKTSLKIRKEGERGERYTENAADTLCWIGKVYREEGQTEKSLKYFETALKAKEKLFGKSSLEVAEVLKNIAVILEDDQELEKSLELYNRSLRIRRELLGDEHDDVCEVLGCVGNIYRSAGDIEMSAAIFQMRLDLQRKISHSKFSGKQSTEALVDAHEDVLDVLGQLQKVDGTPDSMQDEVADLWLSLGHLYDDLNDYDSSITSFMKSLDIQRLSGNQIKSAKVLNAIGIAHGKRGMYEDAMADFQEALSLRKSIFGENHVDLAETLHNMGNCAARCGQLSDARVHFEEALRIKRLILGNKNQSTAQTLHNIGNVLREQNESALALKNYQDALSIRKTCLGDDHLEVAYTLHCIGKLQVQKHETEDARRSFTTALHIKRLRLQKKHPSIADTLLELGMLYFQLGSEYEAIESLNGALKIYKTRKDRTKDLIAVYEVLGTLFEGRNDYSKALEYLEKVLKTRKKSLNDDIALADLMYRIGRAQRELKLDNDALVSFQAATRIRKKENGRTDLTIANILSDAGKLQTKLQHIEVANKCFAEALRIRQSLLHGKHPLIGESLLDVGDVQLLEGHVHSAVESFREALDIFTNDTHDHGATVGDCLYRLASCYEKNGDFWGAKESLVKCLGKRKSINPDSLPVADVDHALGLIYFKEKDFRKAEMLLREGLDIKTKQLGEDHLLIVDTVIALGRVCVEMKSFDEAMMYFEQARLIRQQHLDDSHLECLEVLRYIGDAHMAKGEHEEALTCWNKLLKAWREEVGDDETVADLLHSMGIAEYALQNNEGALKRFVSSLALKRVLLGDEHLSVADTLFHIGLVYDVRRAYKDSMKYHREAFRLRRRLLGEDHLFVAASLDNIAALYMKQPNPTKALHSLKEALRIRSLSLKKDDLEVGTNLFGMGVVFSELNEVDKAMECYTVSLAIRKDKLGESSVEVAQTLHNIGTLYAKQAQYEQALDHWKLALESYRKSGLSDEQHAVAITIGNINMAEGLLDGQSDS